MKVRLGLIWLKQMHDADEPTKNAQAEKTDLGFYIGHFCRQFTVQWGSVEVAAKFVFFF